MYIGQGVRPLRALLVCVRAGDWLLVVSHFHRPDSGCKRAPHSFNCDPFFVPRAACVNVDKEFGLYGYFLCAFVLAIGFSWLTTLLLTMAVTCEELQMHWLFYWLNDEFVSSALTRSCEASFVLASFRPCIEAP